MNDRIGTAGWSIPAGVRDRFPAEGTSLERYAARFACAEINSSFHRPHRPATYRRWAESVPDGFRFAVKVPKTITHLQRLIDCDALLAAFAEQCAPLESKLAVLLVQLPPSLAFDAAFDVFFSAAQARTDAAIACEPRHGSWFDADVDGWLADRRIARVAADPARHPLADRPGGWAGLRYFRLHGSPVIYRSAYERDALAPIAEAIRADPAKSWCIFDNTASSAATGDALTLREMVASP